MDWLICPGAPQISQSPQNPSGTPSSADEFGSFALDAQYGQTSGGVASAITWPACLLLFPSFRLPICPRLSLRPLHSAVRAVPTAGAQSQAQLEPRSTSFIILLVTSSAAYGAYPLALPEAREPARVLARTVEELHLTAQRRRAMLPLQDRVLLSLLHHLSDDARSDPAADRLRHRSGPGPARGGRRRGGLPAHRRALPRPGLRAIAEIVRDDQQAEALAQECFMSAYRSRGHLRRRTSAQSSIRVEHGGPETNEPPSPQWVGGTLAHLPCDLLRRARSSSRRSRSCSSSLGRRPGGRPAGSEASIRAQRSRLRRSNWSTKSSYRIMASPPARAPGPRAPHPGFPGSGLAGKPSPGGPSRATLAGVPSGGLLRCSSGPRRGVGR